jgi:hypothetical protein
MPDEPKQKSANDDAYAQRIADATGITFKQARDLIEVIGYSLPSLLREARMLKARK